MSSLPKLNNGKSLHRPCGSGLMMRLYRLCDSRGAIVEHLLRRRVFRVAVNLAAGDRLSRFPV
jgi:hypothetical protein